MRMRVIRSLVFASVSVMSFFIILSTLTNTTPASPTALHTLVTHTHHHLNHLQNNIKEEFESLVSDPDPEVLQRMGFVEDPVLYPHSNWTNLTSPVIATAVSSSDLEAVSNVLNVAYQVCPGANILIYTLELSVRQAALVETLCNDTCSVVPFDATTYPSHVRNWRLRAYRPIIIQELLVRAGAVLWLDPSIRLVSSVPPSDRKDYRYNESVSHDESDDAFIEGNHLSYSLPSHNGQYEQRKSYKPKDRFTANKNSPLIKDEAEKSFDFPDNVNASGLQAVYPADQAALLNIANRYIHVGKKKVNAVEEEENNHGRKLLMVTLYDDPVKLGKGQRKLVRSKRYLDLAELMKDERTVNEDYASNLNDKNDQDYPLDDPPLTKDDMEYQLTQSRKSTHTEYAESGLPVDEVIHVNNGRHVNGEQISSVDDSPSSLDSDGRFVRPLTNLSHDGGGADKDQYEEDCVLGVWKTAALEHHGVLAWQLSDPLMGHLPTAALTHPGMFSAMHTPKHLYDFHQMSDAGAILLFNTKLVHQHLMKPWLSCSLVHHCVQPIGAQDTGCRFDKKPLFRYSGCHLYDTSAFNVALGLMLGPHNSPYQPEAPVSFTRIQPTPPSGGEEVQLVPLMGRDRNAGMRTGLLGTRTGLTGSQTGPSYSIHTRAGPLSKSRGSAYGPHNLDVKSRRTSRVQKLSSSPSPSVGLNANMSLLSSRKSDARKS